MTEQETHFLTPEEEQLGARFIEQGHVILPVEDTAALDRISRHVATLAAGQLQMAPPTDPGAFLDNIADHMDSDGLNEFRLAIHNGMSNADWFRPAYYGLARAALAALVGNELAMQRRVNLSIQFPDDDSSLLPVHADVWSGDSPFEVVLWVPLVDCHDTKTMFLLPPAADDAGRRGMAELKGGSAEDLFHAIEPDLQWLDVPHGHFVLFAQTLMHGNRINREAGTRWSMNCRFKSVFSPYADKKLGEFFEPVTLRPATRVAMDYRLPGDFDG